MKTCATGPRKNRGKALLQGNLRAPDDDPVLQQVQRDLNPVEVRDGVGCSSFLFSCIYIVGMGTSTCVYSISMQAVRMVQWYPGHIAKAEQELKDQLKAVDMVLEVRDGRIPMSTRHPQIPAWIGKKPRVIILNRRDMITDAEAAEWTAFFKERGQHVMWTNANKGDGVGQVIKAALRVSEKMNEKRNSRGLKPRPVRAVVVGFPNVGKSALINRLLGRRVADSAPRPGVTRVLRWMRIGGDLDLLDAPGIIPNVVQRPSGCPKTRHVQ